jgi:hypothetical protein
MVGLLFKYNKNKLYEINYIILLCLLDLVALTFIIYYKYNKQMNKTLIGKEGYLFLQNDSAKELEVHNNNLCLCSSNLSRFDSIKHKYMMVLSPNKSFLYKQFLPDDYDLKYRPAFDIYKKYFDSHLIDGYEILKNEHDVYYKTDTHINLKGAYMIYCKFIENVNKIFNLKINARILDIKCIETNNLSSLGIGIGDLTWPSNLGNQTLSTTVDNYYYSENIREFYCKHKIKKNDHYVAFFKFKGQQFTHNELDLLEGKIVNWECISNYILYKNNSYKNLPKLKVLIFYDSFLLSTLTLYLEMFDEVYMIKSIFRNDIVAHLNPDFIFEFRVERFLF